MSAEYPGERGRGRNGASFVKRRVAFPQDYLLKMAHEGCGEGCSGERYVHVGVVEADPGRSGIDWICREVNVNLFFSFLSHW